jgi:hypothetical protein
MYISVGDSNGTSILQILPQLQKNVGSLQNGFGFTNQFQILWIELSKDTKCPKQMEWTDCRNQHSGLGGYKVLITFILGLSDISHPRKYFLQSK